MKTVGGVPDIGTKVMKLEVNRDLNEVEVVFPFPYCVKAKDPK